MSQKFLLHVEDDPDDAFLIGHALRAAGVEAPVQVLGNGEEAVHYLRGEGSAAPGAVRPLPDLILLDLNTPLMTGHEFLRWLRAQARIRRIPVVVLTSSRAESDIVSAYDAGANGYLVKPLDHLKMVDVFRDLRAFWLDRNWTEPFSLDPAG